MPPLLVRCAVIGKLRLCRPTPASTSTRARLVTRFLSPSLAIAVSSARTVHRSARRASWTRLGSVAPRAALPNMRMKLAAPLF